MTNYFKHFYLAITLSICSCFTWAQTIQVLHSGNKISLRGLSVVDNKTVWVSGNNGTVGKTADGGKTWKWITVKGFEHSDFRSISALNNNIALIMSIAAPAYILRTTDGGETWTTVYQNNDRGMFLDAMEFWNEESGIVLGDPINNQFFDTPYF